MQVFISSKNTHNFFSWWISPIIFSFFFIFSESANSLALGNTLFSIKSIISLLSVPAWIFKINIFSSPKFINCDNFLIKAVLPHPVSPIIIIGTPSLILNNMKIILIKLSEVKTYFPLIFSKYSKFSFFSSPIFPLFFISFIIISFFFISFFIKLMLLLFIFLLLTWIMFKSSSSLLSLSLSKSSFSFS